MRNHGSRFGLMRMGPHDHIGWIFSGPGEFAALAEPFLAEGAARNEQLMYVAEDPDTASFGAWTESLTRDADGRHRRRGLRGVRNR